MKPAVGVPGDLQSSAPQSPHWDPQTACCLPPSAGQCPLGLVPFKNTLVSFHSFVFFALVLYDFLSLTT